MEKGEIKSSEENPEEFSLEESFVYFIQEKDIKNGPIKIGYSKNPEERLKQLQNSNFRKLKLLFKYKAGKEEESKLHKKFEEYRLYGEWFESNSEIMKFILEKRSKIKMDFSSKKVNNFLKEFLDVRGYNSRLLFFDSHIIGDLLEIYDYHWKYINKIDKIFDKHQNALDQLLESYREIKKIIDEYKKKNNNLEIK